MRHSTLAIVAVTALGALLVLRFGTELRGITSPPGSRGELAETPDSRSATDELEETDSTQMPLAGSVSDERRMVSSAREPTTRLRVRVTEPSGDPIPGAVVVVNRRREPIQIPPGANLSDAFADLFSYARKQQVNGLGRTHRTGTDGQATISLPAGIPLAVRVAGQHYLAGDSETEITAFEEGEQRELVVVLPVGGDLDFFGRVVELRGGTPIPRARVELLDEDAKDVLHSVHTDVDGRFNLRVRSEDDLLLRIRSEGHGEVHGRVVPGHEGAANAYHYRLGRSASLVGRVLDVEDQAIAGADVFVTAFAEHLQQPAEFVFPDEMRPDLDDDVRWRAQTNAEGAFEILGITPRVPLHVVAGSESAGVGCWWQSLGALEPGENAAITLLASRPSTLHGRVVDQHGDPASNLDLWLVPADRARSAYFHPDLDVPEETTTTDESGRYRFEAVYAGLWRIGPDPGQSEVGLDALFAGLLGRARAAEPEFAPLASLVEVAPGTDRQRRDLAIPRNLYLRGRVESSDGEPVATRISATSTAWGAAPGARSGKDGVFALGPLADTPHVLVAGSKSFDGDSAPLTAGPGDEVVLRLIPLAGHIEGTVFFLGEPVAAAEVVVVPGGADFASRRETNTDEHGAFAFRGLPAGVCDVFAATDGGLAGGLSGVSVPARENTVQLSIELEATVRLNVVYRGEDPWAVLVGRIDGVLVAETMAQSGTMVVLRVPAGAVTVELHTTETLLGDFRLAESRELVVAGDKELKIVFE